MSRKIIYLINPISGTRAKTTLQDIIVRENIRQGIDHEIYLTNKEGNYHFLHQKISREHITDVVVCGGDGSVNAVASVLTGTAINIGIIPLGSGNGLANSANIPRRIEAALRVIFAGKASYIDSFYINDEFSCMLCGIGFDAKVAHEFAKKKRRGLQTYIRITAINFFKAQPYAFEIISKERSFSTDAFFISIANSNQFGNNFTIAPEASLDDGLLDIVIVKKMSKLLLPFSILGQVTGINARQRIHEYTGKKNIIYFQTPSLTIINKEWAPLHIDGEPKGSAQKFEVRVVKNAIKLIQPNKG